MRLIGYEAIWTPREVKYNTAASGYICYLDLGYRPKPNEKSMSRVEGNFLSQFFLINKEKLNHI